jgi:hypothetical protein
MQIELERLRLHEIRTVALIQSRHLEFTSNGRSRGAAANLVLVKVVKNFLALYTVLALDLLRLLPNILSFPFALMWIILHSNSSQHLVNLFVQLFQLVRAS